MMDGRFGLHILVSILTLGRFNPKVRWMDGWRDGWMLYTGLSLCMYQMKGRTTD